VNSPTPQSASEKLRRANSCVVAVSETEPPPHLNWTAARACQLPNRDALDARGDGGYTVCIPLVFESQWRNFVLGMDGDASFLYRW